MNDGVHLIIVLPAAAAAAAAVTGVCPIDGVAQNGGALGDERGGFMGGVVFFAAACDCDDICYCYCATAAFGPSSLMSTANDRGSGRSIIAAIITVVLRVNDGRSHD